VSANRDLAAVPLEHRVRGVVAVLKAEPDLTPNQRVELFVLAVWPDTSRATLAPPNHSTDALSRTLTD
jgi:hypothetical protein